MVYSEIISEVKKSKSAMIGAVVIFSLVLLALCAPLLAHYQPNEVIVGALRLPPMSHFQDTHLFLLGTDDLGRDLLSRLLYGARVSLLVGFLVVLFATIVGGGLGLIAGYFGGWTDRIVMRVMDLIMSLPSILFAIVIVTVLGPGIFNAVIAVAVVVLPQFSRIIRAQVLVEKQKPYIEAARLFGSSHLRNIFIEILPNCVAPLVVQATLGFGDGILSCAALGFLGLGAQAPMAEWGAMLADSRAFIESSPYLVTLPGTAILVTVLAFNLLGDGLRDAIDPKLRRTE